MGGRIVCFFTILYNVSFSLLKCKKLHVLEDPAINTTQLQSRFDIQNMAFKSHTMSMKHWTYNCSKIRNSTSSIKSGQKPIGEGKIIVLFYLLITIITGKAYKSISCMQENKSKTTSGSVIKFHISFSFFRGALKTYWNNSFRSIISSILRKF